MKKIAVIGTQGLPAQYGGFETLVENLVKGKINEDIKYTVFCSAPDYNEHPVDFCGAELKYLPFRANGIQSIPYDILSMLRSTRGYDILLILGVSGCLYLPLLQIFTSSRIIVNIDGLEHKRDKWNKWTRRFLRFSEAMAVKFADVIISDNVAIQRYVESTYGKSSEMIAYGGDHVHRNLSSDQCDAVLRHYGISPYTYAITVCRIEPENNCHVILEAFAQRSDFPLVFVGNWNKSTYGLNLKERYRNYKNIHILDPIYDLDVLYVLRAMSAVYVHGHSAGGTNPSLVEAMSLGCSIYAYDVAYNRETTHGACQYFSTNEDLLRLLNEKPNSGALMKQIADEYYGWHRIVSEYEAHFV